MEETIKRISDIFSFTERKLKKSELDEYDVKDEEKIDGRHAKDFFRMKSLGMLPFLKEVARSKQFNYLTYFNDVLEEGIIPENISVLIKRVSEREYAMAEVMSSKVMAFFGLNTPINFAVYTGKDEPTRHFLVSIDFISQNDIFDDLWNLYGIDVSLTDVVKYYREMMEENKDFETISPEKIKLVENQLVLSLLVRTLLMGDTDFCIANVGIIVNDEKNDIELVNFDFEESFNGKMVMKHQVELFKDVRINHPDVYDYFMEKIYLLNSVKDKLNIEYYDESHKRLVANFFARIGKIIEIHNQLNMDEHLPG